MSVLMRRLSNSILNILQNQSIRGEDLWKNLPPDIIIEILSRLPVGTILSCKRVCKSWRDLVNTPDFATSHRSKPTSTLYVAFNQSWNSSYKHFRFVGEQIADESSWVVYSSNWPNPKTPKFLYSSANGLLFLLSSISILFICNPITLEFIELHVPPLGPLPVYSCLFGFGVTKISGKYKIVCITFSNDFRNGNPQRMSTCQAYTLGTGHDWRSDIATCSCLPAHVNNPTSIGVFLNGNLHWLVYDMESDQSWISCLDLETELFTSFSPPLYFPCDTGRLSALGDHLCCYTTSSHDDGLVIWLKKDYGDEKSWTREFIIKNLLPHGPRQITYYPVNVLENGDILLAKRDSGDLLRYSIQTKAIRKYATIKHCRAPFDNIVSYTPNFVSLNTLEMEIVLRFC